jgi:hypothetical protein
MQRRATAIEDEAADGEQEDREAALERRLRHARRQRTAGDRSARRGGRESREKGPVERHAIRVACESRRRVHRDDEERRPDGLAHRHPCQEHERGHDEEAAADPHDSGQNADADGRGEQQHAARRTRRFDSGAAPAQHRHRRGEDDDRQQRELGRATQMDGELRAGECAHHREQPERHRHADPQVAEPPVERGADQARRTDDDEAHRDRRLGPDPEHVHEHGHGEDRAPAAEHAEGDADHRREEEAEGEHVIP